MMDGEGRGCGDSYGRGSWIVYLEANDYIYPAYYCTRDALTGTSTDIIIHNGISNYTSFSIALLNRSLA